MHTVNAGVGMEKKREKVKELKTTFLQLREQLRGRVLSVHTARLYPSTKEHTPGHKAWDTYCNEGRTITAVEPPTRGAPALSQCVLCPQTHMPRHTGKLPQQQPFSGQASWVLSLRACWRRTGHTAGRHSPVKMEKQSSALWKQGAPEAPAARLSPGSGC